MQINVSMRAFKFSLLFAWWLTSVSIGFSTELHSPAISRYGSRLWQTDDGLPQNVVQALAQTSDGYLWVGTQNGLARFDGLRFVTFNPENVPALRSANIYALAEGKDGSLWIGTLNAGVVRLRYGNFKSYGEQDGLHCHAVRTIYAASDGAVWIGTTNGAFCFRDEKFSYIGKEQGLTNLVVRTVCEESNRVLLGTAGGLFEWRNGKASIAVEGLPGPSIRSLASDGKGAVWIGFAGGVVRVIHSQIDESMSAGLSDNIVNVVFSDHRGEMWSGSFGGLSRWRGTNWVSEKTSDGAAFDVVNCIIEDREGNIWSGTKDGLVRFHPQQFERITVQQGLTHHNTMSVLQDRNGTIWTATWGGGVNALREGRVQIFNFANGLARDQALALHEDRAGTLWVGTDFDGGLDAIKDGVIRHFSSTNGLVDPAIRVIHEDRTGQLWIGTREALVAFKDGVFRRFTNENGFNGRNIRALFEDDEGALWIGTSDGLFWFKSGQFLLFPGENPLSAKTVVAFHQDSEHAMWIGTIWGGLCRYANGKLSNYTTAQGLFSNDIHEILEDDAGFLWMSCRFGVFRVRKKQFDDLDDKRIASLTCRAFGKRDGLPSIDCNVVAKPAAWKDREGRLWFATTKGLAVVDPKSDVHSNPLPPPVMIEEVIADKKVQSLKFKVQGSAAEPTLNLELGTLNLSPGNGELEIHYTALSFSDSEKNRFRYRLENLEPDWVDAGARRTAFYSQLAPGDYTFRVIACNNDGTWNSTGASLKLILQPHFWQTIWFKGAMAALLLGTVGWGVHSLSVRRLEQQMRRLEQQTALANERSRIAKDMHDDLGARLTQIMLLSDVVEKSDDAGPKTKSHATKIAGASRELVQNLDAIVWAVDPGNDTLDQLALYLHDYVDRYVATAGIQGCFNVPSNLPSCSISSQVRHDVFMIVKEALNNAVKYSNCTEIRFVLGFSRGELKIEIADNGCGFDRDRITPGNGLNNMEQRMRRAGGRLHFESVPGKGTRIEIQIPLKADA